MQKILGFYLLSFVALGLISWMYISERGIDQINRYLMADTIGLRQSSGRVRIFCVILTSDSNWMTKRMAVKLTWAQRCDNYCFFYTPHNITRRDPHACAMKTPDGHNKLTPKVLEAFKYTRHHFNSTYDWMLKADDDTYVIMENLKAFLSKHNPTKAHFFGHLLTNELKIVPHGHLSGGAGYVLSSKALELLLTNSSCRSILQEDLHVSRCLSQLKIYPESTKDENELNRFHSEGPLQMLSRNDWPYNYKKGNFTVTKGKDGIFSRSAISFHHLTSEQIYTYDYLIYGLKRNTMAMVQN